MPRDADRSHLHPAFRAIAADIDARLAAAGLEMALYEGGRSPQRQADLFCQGRATGCGTYGKFVTRAKPWAGFHQFGLAGDWVFNAGGVWTWEEPSPGAWAKYTEIAASADARTLSFERPHCELPVSLADLQAGRYPAGGDDSWQAWLEMQIEGWGPEARSVLGIMMPGAPPSPSVGERPPLAA